MSKAVVVGTDDYAAEGSALQSVVFDVATARASRWYTRIWGLHICCFKWLKLKHFPPLFFEKSPIFILFSLRTKYVQYCCPETSPAVFHQQAIIAQETSAFNEDANELVHRFLLQRVTNPCLKVHHIGLLILHKSLFLSAWCDWKIPKFKIAKRAMSKYDSLNNLNWTLMEIISFWKHIKRNRGVIFRRWQNFVRNEERRSGKNSDLRP